jgi:hypothetical protein
MNGDGIINEADIEVLLSLIINNVELFDGADINFDSIIDIFDLLLLSDVVQDL